MSARLRIRVHTDGRWAVLADPGDRWPWLSYPPGPLAPPGGVDWLADATVHEPGWSEVAVVELPAVVLREQRVNGIGLEIEVPTPDGRQREVTGCHVPGYDEDRVGMDELGWCSLADARHDATRILAACDAVERLRAEHSSGGPG